MKLALIVAVAYAVAPAYGYTGDTVGDHVYSPSGKLLGREIIDTEISGTWTGLATALEAVDGAVIRTDAAHQICLIGRDGATRCDAQRAGKDGALHNVPAWTGRLYWVRDQVYSLVNGDPYAPEAGCALYEVMVSRSGDTATAALLSTSECSGITKEFWEMNHMAKMSDAIDYSIADEVSAISNQWVKD